MKLTGTEKMGVPQAIEDASLNPAVVPLLHARSGDVAGYRIIGAANGPRVLATGYRPVVGEAFHRLAQLPNLPWLRGSVTLVFSEAADGHSKELSWSELFNDQIDGVVLVTAQSLDVVPPDQREDLRQEAYWTVLRLCTDLGMIAGRGVRRTVNPALTRYFKTALTPGPSSY